MSEPTKKRGKQNEVFRGKVRELVADPYTMVGELRDEIQEWADNVPENFQEKQDALSAAADALDSTESAGQQAESALGHEALKRFLDDEIEYTQDTRAASTSRADRLDNAIRIADAIRSWAEEVSEKIASVAEENDADEDKRDEVVDAFQEVIDALEEFVSEAQGVEFPGMYG